jgi:glycerol-3-phosphate dehydrogenase
MHRDLDRLATTRFDLLVVGGGIHGLAAAYDAAQRGLSVALVERGDFGGAASFNHLKTVHGGLRYLQSADLKRMRESIVERRTVARIAPHLLTPLPFLMPTYRKLTRSRLAMRVAFLLDATVGYDRNEGVPQRLRLPHGRTLSRGECLRLFPDVRRRGLTGGALWYDYQVRNTDRLTLAFAVAAANHGACLVNYADARSAMVEGGRVQGLRVRDVQTGTEVDVRASLTLNAAGAGAAGVMKAFGADRPWPLLKAMNLVTSRPMSGPALASSTDDGRMLFVVPWEGRAVAGTSHSQTPAAPDQTDVSPEELQAFIAEVNEAFPSLGLQPADVTLVHRGIVPAARNRRGELDLEGHFHIYDHASDGIDGALSLVGVKYTTGRGVAEQAVNVVMRKLGRTGASRTATTPLPAAVEDLDGLLADLRRNAPARIGPATSGQLALTYGRDALRVMALANAEPELGAPIAPGLPVLKAQVVHAVREEMAVTLTDVVTRRTPLGSAGHPGRAAVEGCARVMAHECGWNAAREAAEVAAVARFYAPATVPDEATAVRR